ncbi:TRAP transporter substrate-binding protein [Salicibibacter cibarius]|uniref:TRAP transporter substrate-binding protein n=1 Tax=Salicibibacter cibarius TaxID=2743000 RepID=A0A7T6Z138_9BACI|nr:TRAP transporter substrate-binding protein [Salicibibacter cibarius]QQK74727.1 TRAP transporter substrate-binding protein [Salicibibacter cibarius]
MDRRQLFGFFLLLLFISACGNEEANVETVDATNNGEQKVITLGHVTADDHILHLAVEKFKEEVEERSDGSMTVDIYPQQQLGGEADMMDQLRNGTLDMGALTIAELTARSEAFNAWYMPYLLGGLDATEEMRQTEEADEILHSLDDHEGVHPLSYYVIENRHVFSVDEPVTTMEDFRNLQVRIPPGTAIDDFYQRLGATPSPVEQQEVYTSLQTGVLEAADVDVDAVLANRYHEVGDHVAMTGHHDWVIGVLYSQPLWDQLTEEQQTIVEESIEIAAQYSHEISGELQDEYIERAQEEGVEIHEFEDMDEITEIAEEMHEDYATDNELIENFIEKAREIENH